MFPQTDCDKCRSALHQHAVALYVSHAMFHGQVYAPTFPGYGRSEKQSLAYSQELWRDFLRDFVIEVVQRPVVVAGNSIGGFISASLAADYPSLVKGGYYVCRLHQNVLGIGPLLDALHWHVNRYSRELLCRL